jgi:hypothetical protein
VGKPIHVNDAYRCGVCNQKLRNAAKDSQHRLGMAADIQVEGMTAAELYRAALRVPAIRGIGVSQGNYVPRRRKADIARWCYDASQVTNAPGIIRSTHRKMKLPLGLGNLDITDWARGILSAFIIGGASAVTSSFVVATTDPTHYAPGTGNFFRLVAYVFAVSGTLGAIAFLRTKPLPEIKKTVTEKVTEQDGRPVKTEITTQTTTITASDGAQVRD